MRKKLEEVGLFRLESGHEHFNGSIVFPIFDGNNQVSEVYGRKIRDDLRKGTAYHLYLPGPHKGIFNRECFRAPAVVIPPDMDKEKDFKEFLNHGDTKYLYKDV